MPLFSLPASDGLVFGFGDCTQGQTGDSTACYYVAVGTSDQRAVPLPLQGVPQPVTPDQLQLAQHIHDNHVADVLYAAIPGLTNASLVAAGPGYSLVLGEKRFGNPGNHACFVAYTTYPTPPDTSVLYSFGTCAHQVLGRSCGGDQAGHDATPAAVPLPLAAAESVLMLCAGTEAAAAATTIGVYVWGDAFNSLGPIALDLGVPPSGITGLACGDTAVYAIANGALVSASSAGVTNFGTPSGGGSFTQLSVGSSGQATLVALLTDCTYRKQNALPSWHNNLACLFDTHL